MSNVTTNQENENEHLASEHGLTKTTAYIRYNSAKQRSSGAERVARHRARKKEKGLVQIDIPTPVADEIKAAGSFATWMKQFRRYSPEQIKIINESIQIAHRARRLHPWLRWLLDL